MSRTEVLVAECTHALAESFADIVNAAKIEQKDKYKIAQESYQTECRATNIVRQAEGLLSVIADLKQSLLVNDEQQLLHITATRRMECIDQKDVIKARVARLKDDLDLAIWDLEDVYYSSPYR